MFNILDKKMAKLSLVVTSCMLAIACKQGGGETTSNVNPVPVTNPPSTTPTPKPTETKNPNVTQLLHSTLQVDKLATITIYGVYLNQDVSLLFPSCTNITTISSSDTKIVFSCMPMLTGQQSITIMDKNNNRIFSKQVNVQSTIINVEPTVSYLRTQPNDVKRTQIFNLVVLGNNLPINEQLQVRGCKSQSAMSLTSQQHIYKCTAPEVATLEHKLEVINPKNNQKLFNTSIVVGGTVTATGINNCFYTDNNTYQSCSLLPSSWLGLLQDGEIKAGTRLNYTLLQRNGEECVKDNATGLIWEQKTNDGGLRDKDNKYSWYNSNPNSNGGSVGHYNNGQNTEEYIKQLNASNYCGYNSWRMPTVDELESLLDYSLDNPALSPIFTNVNKVPRPYFGYQAYYSSTPSTSKDVALAVRFLNYNEYRTAVDKTSTQYIRAVQSDGR